MANVRPAAKKGGVICHKAVGKYETGEDMTGDQEFLLIIFCSGRLVGKFKWISERYECTYVVSLTFLK